MLSRQAAIEQMRQVREEQEVQSLYNAIYYPMEKYRETDPAFYEKSHDIIGKNMFTLIQLLKDGSKLSSFDLTRYVIPLINKILTVPSSQIFVSMPVLSMFQDRELAINLLAKLHEACKDENFRVLLCDIQKIFMGNYRFHAEQEPRYLLLEEMSLLQFRLSKSSNTVEQEAIKEEIRKTEHKTQVAMQKALRVEQFCDRYKVTV